MSEKLIETDINTHIILVSSWIEKGDLYLLAQREENDPQAGGLWALVGGKVDMELGAGVIEETLRREIREEVGLEIADEIKYLTSQAFIRSSGHHVVNLVFKVTHRSGEAQPLEGHSQVKWMLKEEIDHLIQSDPRLSYLENSFALLES